MAFFLGALAATALDPIFLAVAFVAYKLTGKNNIGIRILVFAVLGLILAFLHGWLSSANLGASDSINVSTFILGFAGFMIDVGFIFLIAKIIKGLRGSAVAR